MTFDVFIEKHSKLTRSLKKFILDQQSKLTPENFELFLESIAVAHKQAREKLEEVPAGISRSARLNQLVDQVMEEENHIKATCKMDCSACCHVEVKITSDETEVLSHLIQSGHTIDLERLADQAKLSVGDARWKKNLNLRQNQCVFLNSLGNCSVYKQRPVMCRRHSVTSPAHLCSSLDADIVLRYFPRVDILISAANEDPDLKVGPLAKMLHEKLNTRLQKKFRSP